MPIARMLRLGQERLTPCAAATGVDVWMAKGRISYGKRFALWQAHSGRCGYCGVPVRLLDMQVDHILPEWLLSDPERFNRLKREYALEESFDLRDYCNWLPTHAACNRQKGATVPDRNFAVYFISLARGKIAKAKAEEERYAATRAADQVVGKLFAAVAGGVLTKEEVFDSLASLPEPVRSTFDPIVICFGLSVYQAIESGLLPRNVPTDYPSLCDWLEADLLERVRAIPSSECFYPEASARNGEALSVRLALIEPELDALCLSG
jgi:hypothetical protein